MKWLQVGLLCGLGVIVLGSVSWAMDKSFAQPVSRYRPHTVKVVRHVHRHRFGHARYDHGRAGLQKSVRGYYRLNVPLDNPQLVKYYRAVSILYLSRAGIHQQYLLVPRRPSRFIPKPVKSLVARIGYSDMVSDINVDDNVTRTIEHGSDYLCDVAMDTSVAYDEQQARRVIPVEKMPILPEHGDVFLHPFGRYGVQVKMKRKGWTFKKITRKKTKQLSKAGGESMYMID